MRDELDNAAGLETHLQNGGMELLAHATEPEDEDTFLLGPDIIEQIGRKQRIMRAHWLDAEGYLESPHK